MTRRSTADAANCWPWANLALAALVAFFSSAGLREHDRWQRESAAAAAEAQTALANAGVLKQQLHESLTTSPIVRFAVQPERFRLWQALSHLFVHKAVWVLVGNLVFLVIIGSAVNSRIGHLPFLATYFGIGILFGLAWWLAGQSTPMVGLSGAIAGLAGVFVVLCPNQSWIPLGLTKAAETRTVPSWGVVAAFFAFAGLSLGISNGWVALPCLAAAFIAGVSVGVALLAAGAVRRISGDRNLLQQIGFNDQKVVIRWAKRRKIRRKRAA